MLQTYRIFPAHLKTNLRSSIEEIYGLFLLHPSEEEVEKTKLDIVAIHGLMGGYLETWTRDGLCWPHDSRLLPLRLPDARVLSFGYNASLAFTKSKADTHDIALDLLNQLVLHRLAFPPTRPIVLICHSLGGIIAKQALVTAHEDSGEEFSDLLSAVQDIGFLGVPDRGSQLASYANTLLSTFFTGPGRMLVDHSLLAFLKDHSQQLQYLNDSAKQRLGQVPYIYSFYETEVTARVKIVVDKESATTGITHEKIIPVTADHVNICKFNTSESKRYETVAGHIQRMGLLDSFSAKYKSRGESLLDDLEELWLVCSTCLKKIEQRATIILILDGLEKCRGKELEQIFRYLADILDLVTCRIKVIITSAAHVLIRDSLKSITNKMDQINFQKIDHDDEGVFESVEQAIHKYISVKIEELPALSEWSQEQHEKLGQILKDRADGTYLWVSLILHAIPSWEDTSEQNLEILLLNMPTGLNQTYDTMFNLLPNWSAVRTRIFGILFEAVEPLSLPQLNDCLAVNICLSVRDRSLGPSKFNLFKTRQLDIERTIKISCGSFVHVIDGFCYFSHSTARDFIFEKIHKPSMMNVDLIDCYVKQISAEHFETFNGRCTTWENVFGVKKLPILGYGLLHVAVLGKQLCTVSWLLQCNHHLVFERDAWNRTPLHLAASRDAIELVELLMIYSGVTVDAQDNNNETPLDYAKSCDLTDATTLLSSW
ncbi:MAG: hypothetical protein Q9167_006133, partial [Letrouitia subvulpina]